MIDRDQNRLNIARRFGATQTINIDEEDPIARVKELTGGIGVDTAVEAVGIPPTFELCEDIIAPGGCIANVGVHGEKVDLHLEKLWNRNITITTRLVDTATTGVLLRAVQSKKLDPALLITHRYSLERILDAYDTFGRAAEAKVLKVVISA
jgi:alcohol dehydrogenase